MKRTMLTVALLLSLILCSFSVYAANGDLIVNGEITLGTTTGNIQGIHTGTSSGSDVSALSLSGGGAANDYSRGAVLNLFGNNIDIFGGCALISAGNSSTGLGGVGFLTDDKLRMIISSSGNVGIGGSLSPEATLDVKGTVKVLGDWATKTLGTVYQAESDGFVVATITNSTNGNLQGFTGTSNTPTNPPNILRGYAHAATPVAILGGSFTFPVKKGEYWRVARATSDTVTATVTIDWIPLGHQ